jgi:MYXO-CTERM domain-containing protein
MNDADSGIDAGTKGPIDTEEVDPTDSTHATSDHEQNAVDAAPQDNASSSALDAGDEEPEVEKPPVAPESDDSGCGVVAVGSHGTTTSLGLLITALASVFFRRRRIGEREAFAGRGFSRRR